MDLKLQSKMALAFLAYSLRWTRVPVGPLFVTLETGNTCNLRCPMCPQSTRDDSFPEGRMSLERFEELLHEVKRFAPIACLTLHLSAEPLLHPQVTDMLRMAHRVLGRRAGFASNGVALTKKRGGELLDAGLGWLTVDFCADRETFEKNRHPANWDRVYKNLTDFLTLVAERNADIDIQVKNVDWGENQEKSMQELRDLFQGLPVSKFTPYRLHNWSADFAEGASSRLGFNFLTGGKYYPCSHLWFSLIIAYDGRVHLCCRDTEGDHIIADTATQTPGEIWNSDAYRELRRLHAKGKYDEIPACKPCDRVWTGGYAGVTSVQSKVGVRAIALC
jgi:radical SAM protein with 4Fe4S-binding SPASM domain